MASLLLLLSARNSHMQNDIIWHNSLSQAACTARGAAGEPDCPYAHQPHVAAARSAPVPKNHQAASGSRMEQHVSAPSAFINSVNL